MFNNWRELLDWSNPDYCYVVLAIARSKNAKEEVASQGHGHVKSEAAVYRELAATPDNLEHKLHRLKVLINNTPDLKPEWFNLYITFNPRSLWRGYNMLKKQFADWDMRKDWNRLDRIHREFISQLQQEGCRGNRFFYLLDIDTKIPELCNEIEQKLKENSIEPVFKTETNHGFHWLVKPFDIRIVEQWTSQEEGERILELHKDALLNITWQELDRKHVGRIS